MSSNIGIFSRSGEDLNSMERRHVYAHQAHTPPRVWDSPPASTSSIFEPAVRFLFCCRIDSTLLQRTPKAVADPVTALVLDYGNLFTGTLLSYPCVVVRRQCQVNARGGLHLTPFTLVPSTFSVAQMQGPIALWKGVLAMATHRAIVYLTEKSMSDLLGWPRTVSSQHSNRKITQHIWLKSTAIIIGAPVLIQTVVESTQSACASEKPQILDCLWDGFKRAFGPLLGGPPISRQMIPVWQLVPPTLAFGLAHYVVSSGMYYALRQFGRRYMNSRQRYRGSFDDYYPTLFASFASLLAADALLYPFDTALSRLFVQGTRTIIDNMDTGTAVIPVQHRYAGLFSCLSSIVRDEGALALYKGFGALLMQYLIQFGVLKALKFVYELIDDAHGGRRIDSVEARSPILQQFINSHQTWNREELILLLSAVVGCKAESIRETIVR